MASTTAQAKENLNNCKSAAMKLIGDMNAEDINKKLETISRIDQLQDFSCDAEAKDLKDYKELKEVLKKLYVATARTIISILNTDSGLSSNPEDSFNYREPVEQISAAEYIKKLPNAFIGGPMKAALGNPYAKIRQIAVDYYDSLPHDIRYSGIFPPDFSKIVVKIRAQLKE